MDERQGITGRLMGHFFRRFFDNDTVQSDGDTLTTVVRAISAVAMPGLTIAFFLQNQYPHRTRWGAIQDQAFFVLFSFVVLGAVTIFEWEMLFPDRIDFLVLSPLPLKPMQMLLSKGAALFGFALLFLVGANALGALVYTMVAKGPFWRQLFAHGMAVLLAGIFAVLAFLASNGLLRCVLDTPRFRLASPVAQMLSVMALVLLLLAYVEYGDSLPALLSTPAGPARWLPPLWFLGLYDQLLYGASAPAFARPMAAKALGGTLIAATLVLITYPLAWGRMRRMALEDGSSRRRAARGWWSSVTNRLLSRPEERAIFHFIGQTLRRNNRYQVYLALYCGTGLALAVACAVRLHVEEGGARLAISDPGLHATLPLLLFWVVAGLRSAFALPLNLPARWLFRIVGANSSACAAAAPRWALLCALAVACANLLTMRAAGWGLRRLLVQAVCGVCLAVLLTDGFFVRRSLPFTQPRLPGRVNFPLMLTLYIGVLGPFLFAMVYLEGRMERGPAGLLVLVGLTAAIHAAVRYARRSPMEVEEEMEGYEGEFQLLGLG